MDNKNNLLKKVTKDDIEASVCRLYFWLGYFIFLDYKRMNEFGGD